MRKLHSKRINKIVITIIAIIMLCNFVMPNISYADTDAKEGDEYFDPLAKFLVFLCDSFFQFMQETFVSMQSIQNVDGTYNFQYSPAKIFSGDVSAFDANFVSPNDVITTAGDYSEVVKHKADTWKKAIPNLDFYKSINQDPPENMDEDHNFDDSSNFELAAQNPNARLIKDSSFLTLTGSYTVYYWIEEDNIHIEGKFKFAQFGRSYYYGETIKTYDSIAKQYANQVEYKSVANVLRKSIVSWYKAFRRIALVGLLSALLYVGIRMVISSISEKDSSKYKKMFTDWLVAICLLFTLHYLMNFIIIITGKLIDILAPSTLTDPLLNDVRFKIFDSKSWGEQTGRVIIYLVLTIYTITFTYQYLKRVIYLAFFTMIAPLICLTYPLDKINDGKAQAFSFWLKEYIFNSLIPVVHLLIYIVLVSTVQDLAVAYPLYAILAIGFLTKAEQLFRKMFGLDNSETFGFLQTAATAGIIATMLNKLNKIPTPKGEKSAGEEGSPKGVRTTNGDSLAGLRTAGAGTQGGGGTPGQQQQTQGAGQGGQNGGGGTPTQQPQVQPQNQGIPANLNQSNKPKIKPFSGVGSLAKKYTGPVLSKMAGIGLGGAGALIGFSAGVAQGDIGKALTGATAGGAAGYHGGQKLGNAGANMITGATFGNLKNKWNNVTDTFNEGARGKEYVQNVRFDREFYKSEGYKKLMEDHEGTPKETIQDMLNAGITDPKDMDKILTNSTGGNLAEEIGYYTLAKDCDNGVFYDDAKLEKYIEGKLGAASGNIREVYDRMKKYK